MFLNGNYNFSKKRNMKKVEITVLRKMFFEDLAEKYLTDGGNAGACPL
jgi:hypothetical protein